MNDLNPAPAFRFIAIAVSIVALLFLGGLNVSAAPLQSPLQISVSIGKTSISTQDQLPVTITIANVSEQPVAIPQFDGTNQRVYLQLRASQPGKTIFFIPAAVDTSRTSASNTQVLQPGQKLEFTDTLNEVGLGPFTPTNPQGSTTSFQAATGVFDVGAQFVINQANRPTGGDPNVITGTFISPTIKVSILSFDVCMKDNTTGDVLQFSSTTGAYTFTTCNGSVTMSGTGSVRSVNGVLTLTDTQPDRRVSAGFNTGQKTGSATISKIVAPGVSQTFRINDTTSLGTGCACSGT